MCTHLCLVEQITGGQELLGEVGWCKTLGITVPQSEECIRPARCVRAWRAGHHACVALTPYPKTPQCCNCKFQNISLALLSRYFQSVCACVPTYPERYEASVCGDQWNYSWSESLTQTSRVYEDFCLTYEFQLCQWSTWKVVDTCAISVNYIF